MQIRVKDDSVELEGYVNAIERNSKPLRSRIGRFIERVCKGTFTKAISRNNNIRLLLNHDWNRDLGGTAEGNLELREDSIGLHARATVTDEDVIMKARNGELVGWSFGFFDTPDGVEESVDDETKLPLRKLRDMELREVSILDKTRNPAYEGTLVAVRSDEEYTYYGEPMMSEMEIREDVPKQPETKEAEEIKIDYSKYENMIAEMREE